MTALGFQASLLDALSSDDLPQDSIAPGELGGQVRRTELSDGAWCRCAAALDHRRRSVVRGAARHTVDWRAEQRPMYDKVVTVPPAALLRRRGPATAASCLGGRQGRPRRALPGRTRRGTSRPPGCCLYRDGRDSVAWHGDRIGRGKHPRHDGRDHRAGRAARARTAAASRRGPARAVPASRAGPRRSRGDGRQLPAHLGTRGAQDGTGGRAADQRAVPPARRPLIQPPISPVPRSALRGGLERRLEPLQRGGDVAGR